ncbi:MAG: PKD domain-containing protein, partial [Bacteroidota bacterium]
MKKLLLQILLLLLVLPAISQNFVFVTGTVIDTATGNPIPNHAVTISNDSSGGWIYYQTTYTNNSGFYSDTIPVPLNTQGILYVRTADCQNYLHQVVVTYMPTVLNFTVNFAICYSNSPCVANFSYSQFASNSIQFMDLSQSQGIPVSWAWDFGDGGTSTVQNPMHIFGSSGWYNVMLSIYNQSGCSSSVIHNVFVSDSTAGGCQAAFIAVPDSVNTFPNTFNFIDQSSGNIISWLWNFGDPMSGVMNTSTAQNPTHTYSTPGVYTACLTIHGADSTCNDMTCETLVVGTAAGCNAAFTYSVDTLNSGSIVQFTDLSSTTSGYITTWVWNFGDGLVQTVTFPGNPNVTHTYLSPGIYNVCLKIQGSDSTCDDMACQSIYIGFNSGCNANFNHSYPTSSSFPIQFTDLSQASGGAPITSWNWNFG